MEISNFTINMYEEVHNLWKIAGLSLGGSDTEIEVARMLEHSPELFIVGKIESKIIAVVMGAFDGRRGYVHHLTVDPEFQKKGYGRELMEELHKRFLNKGVVKAHLFLEIENKGVIEFYQKMGWYVRDDLEMMSYNLNKNYPDKC
ncbi:MAG: GNAT family N-acetyltransferase [Candidatus Heimdallarchaeaceae archaeon]